MKKVLYFFPDNIGRQTAGNKTRAIHLLKYFHQKKYSVDFVSLKNEKGDNGTEAETLAFIKDNNLATRTFLLNRKPGKKNAVLYFLRYKIRDLVYYWINYPAKSNIPTFLTVKLKHYFESILKANSYDYIIISYVQCAGLVADRKLLKGAKTFIDTHDLITAQFKSKRGFNLGATFQDEISRLNSFDEVWAISTEEQYIFNQFCRPVTRLIPVMMNQPEPASKPYSEKQFDLIYVASDNVHNIKSAQWFFDNVYPLLPAGLSICMIGRINEHIEGDYPAVERVLFAEDLELYYQNARIGLCPMLQGTGVKVKVIEAMAFGLPVVCTTRGTDGLPNKQDNGCLVSDDPARFAENIMALLNDRVFYDTQGALSKKMFNTSFKDTAVFKLLDDTFKA